MLWFFPLSLCTICHTKYICTQNERKAFCYRQTQTFLALHGLSKHSGIITCITAFFAVLQVEMHWLTS